MSQFQVVLVAFRDFEDGVFVRFVFHGGAGEERNETGFEQDGDGDGQTAVNQQGVKEAG